MKITKDGYTLVELLVVIIIISIIAMIAIPRFMSMIRGAKQGATKGYISTLRAATRIYYADTGGYYPYQNEALTATDPSGNRCLYIITQEEKNRNAWVPRYMSAWVPKVRIGYQAWGAGGTSLQHEEGNDMKIVDNNHTPHINTDWLEELIYNRDSGDAWINCDLTDREGKKYSDW